MFLKLGGCGPSVEAVEQRVVAALVADRRRDLQVHAGPAAERPAEMPRPHLAHLRERQQLLVERAEDPPRALLLVDRQVGPRNVAHEQRVSAQHGPRLGAARGVHEREGRVLGTMPRRVERPDDELAESELPAVLEGLVVVFGLSLGVDVNHRPGGRCEAPVPRDVVGVVVRLEDVLDPHS